MKLANRCCVERGGWYGPGESADHESGGRVFRGAVMAFVDPKASDLDAELDDDRIRHVELHVCKYCSCVYALWRPEGGP